jgi:hypothetical protein
MNDFILGMLAMGFVTAALFFRRFWQRSRDSLFRLFAMAFAILAVSQVALLQFGESSEYTLHLYALRLFAFLLILLAIYRKNRDPGLTSREPPAPSG